MTGERTLCAVDGCELLGPFGDMWNWAENPSEPPVRRHVCGYHHKVTEDRETAVRINGMLLVRFGGRKPPIRLV